MFNPSKVIAIGLNYYDHAREMNVPVPETPLIFLKAPTTVIEDGQTIIYPPQTQELHYEGELVVVIKNRIKGVTAEEARQHILGYTCGNDVTARDLQRTDGQWARSKSFDTFCPLGPRVTAEVDPLNLAITTRVNGIVKQQSTTGNMVHDVYRLVSFISTMMTLLPGDVILTGTPPGVGPLNVGDEVEVEIEGIGVLKNRIGKE